MEDRVADDTTMVTWKVEVFKYLGFFDTFIDLVKA